MKCTSCNEKIDSAGLCSVCFYWEQETFHVIAFGKQLRKLVGKKGRMPRWLLYH